MFTFKLSTALNYETKLRGVQPTKQSGYLNGIASPFRCIQGSQFPELTRFVIQGPQEVANSV
jgi:hypothetical protein